MAWVAVKEPGKYTPRRALVAIHAKLHFDEVGNARTSESPIALFQCGDGSDECLARARRARSCASTIAAQAAVFSLHPGALKIEYPGGSDDDSDAAWSAR